MNGGRGFHHKAVKGQSAGGHFNGGANIVRSHLCRLSKQHIANALKGVNSGFLQMAVALLRTPLIVPAGFGRVPPVNSKQQVYSNHDGRQKRRGAGARAGWTMATQCKEGEKLNSPLRRHGNCSRYLLHFQRKTATSFSVRRCTSGPSVWQIRWGILNT